MLKKIILFLLLNFTALAVGGLFTSSGVSSDWYQNLNQAPWTPPGWVFGAAWTFIMICFAIYMAYLIHLGKGMKNIILLFSLQWILNVVWNPIFFKFHLVAFGLIVISALTILVGYFLIKNKNQLKAKSLLILPYLIWLIIATSLNGYIYFNN
jgi:tryptophan-rich sensory protein